MATEELTVMFFAKLHTNILRDADIQQLRDALWRRLIELLVIAVEEANDGVLPSLRNMAWVLHIEPEILEAEMNELADAGFLERRRGEWIFSNLDSWQKSQTPNARRLREWRKRKAEEGEEAPAPLFRSQPPDQEIEQEQDQDQEYIYRCHDTPVNVSRTFHERFTNVSRTSPRYDSETLLAFLRERDIPAPQTDEEWELIQSDNVMLWLSITNRWPGWTKLRLISQHLGSEGLASDTLSRAYQLWILSGFKPDNILGVMEWYRLLADDPDWTPQRKYQQKPAQDSEAKILELLEVQ